MENIPFKLYLSYFLIAVIILLTLTYTSGEFHPARYYSLLCDNPNASPDGNWNHNYHGFYIGAQGCLYDPDKFKIDEVPPIVAYEQASDNTPAWYINGINQRINWTYLELQIFSRQSQRPVIGIYNATKGGRLPDLLKKIDKTDKVVANLSASIAQLSAKGKTVFIRANSQGAHYASLALAESLEALRVAFEETQFKDIAKNIQVETGAAATNFFPTGPKYLHYINSLDPVPRRAGILSKQHDPSTPLILEPNTVIARFSAKDKNPLEAKLHWLGPISKRFISVHGFNIYLKHRLPFEQIYSEGMEIKSRIVDIK